MEIKQNHSGIGHNFASQNSQQEQSKKTFFSMDNPIVYLIVIGIIAIVGVVWGILY